MKNIDKVKKVNARLKRHGWYLTIASLWVGKLMSKGEQVLDDQQYRDVFSPIEDRNYVKLGVYDDPEATKDILTLNLLRTWLFEKLPKPAIRQSIFACLVLGCGAVALQMALAVFGGHHDFI